VSAGEYIAGREISGDVTLDCDVVIVGSGASGSVVAAKLAEAGQRVLVVEEGGRTPPREYARMRPSESLRALWREGGSTAAFGIGDTPVINVTMGRCVGGSSVLTGGVCFRTPDFVLDHWSKELGLRELSPAGLEPYFDEVEENVNVQAVPTAMRSKSTALWAKGAEKRGIDVKPLRRNTSGCQGIGQCNFGCPEGSKMSVDVSYLPRAVEQGTRVLSDCLVKKVVIKFGRAVGVEGRLLDRQRRERGRVTISARRVVLAAGAVHTPLILWASGVKNRQLGRNMTVHPAFRVIARFDEEVRGWAGSLQSAYSDDFENRGITLVSVFVPPFAVAGGVPGVGPQWTERVRQLDHLAMFGGMLHDDGGGRVWRPRLGREPIITYRMSRKDRARIPTIVRLLAEAYLAAGAKELFIPVLGHEPLGPDEFRKLDLERIPARAYECSSQHPLGTCRVGTSKANSVVDENGRVWDADDLYVVDGGTLPTSLGVNPQVTVMAMATRFAERMAEYPFRD
jgi:choline dehydrogenase-like flavoprotein